MVITIRFTMIVKVNKHCTIDAGKWGYRKVTLPIIIGKEIERADLNQIWILERERERERQRERETERERERQREREREREKQSETETERQREAKRETERHGVA